MSNADVYISVNGSCFLEDTAVTEKLSQSVVILVCDSVTVLGETCHDVIYLKAKRLLVHDEQGSPHILIELCNTGKILERACGKSQLLLMCGAFDVCV